jgi:uncharacterized protein (TIGR02246 family)
MHILRTAAFVAAGLVALGGCVAKPTDTAADMAAVSATASAWFDAFNAGDADAIAAQYADDAVIMPAGAAPISGHAAIRDYFAADIANSKAAGTTSTLSGVTHAEVFGDNAYITGAYSVTDTAGVTVDTGKFLSVFRRSTGQWLMIRDTWNSSAPPATEGGTLLGLAHEVKDFDHWWAAWQGPDSRHQMFAKHGAPKVRVLQNQDNPRQIELLVEVTDMEAFMAFLNSPEGVRAKAEDGVKDGTLRSYAEIK